MEPVTDEGIEGDEASVVDGGDVGNPEPEPGAAADDDVALAPGSGSAADAAGGMEATDSTAEHADASEGQAVSRYRRPMFAVARAVVVLVVAAIGYQAVVPYGHPVRSRLSQLAVTKPGVRVFDIKPAVAKQLPAAQSGLSAVVAAGKKSPDKTGAYTVQWTPSRTEGAGLVVFLLPTRAQAAKTFSQVKAQQLGAKAYSASGLALRSSYKVAAVPGSVGSLYDPTTKTSKAAAKPPSLAVDAFTFGRVVALTETVTATNPQGAANHMAVTELGHLRAVRPHFTLMVVSRSTLATALWAVGSVLLAALAALLPYGWRRRRSVRFPPEMCHQLRARAATEHVSEADIIRQAVAEHLTRTA